MKPVTSLPQAVLDWIRRHDLLKAGERVGVAVSGGADSVALLRLLLEMREELGVVLAVAHFNHKLRGSESDQDESFARQLAEQHNLDFLCGAGDVRAHASRNKISLESAARAMRYEYFYELLRKGSFHRIATGHTLDDQAETVLLRLIRGAGTRGLAGIYPELKFGHQPAAASIRPSAIVRPLLSTRRTDLEAYLKSIGQPWREDSSNRDLRHARNRVRHGVLPRLERNLNPAVRAALAETAEIARSEEEYWDAQVSAILPSLTQTGANRTIVKLKPLTEVPLALQRRTIRRVGEVLGLKLEFRHVENVLQFASPEFATTGPVALPDGWMVSRKQGTLRFERQRNVDVSDYDYALSIPGAVDVPELGCRFEAELASRGSREGYNPEQAISRVAVGPSVRVRNWRAGDRFWPAHTKAPKKIKELLYERHLSGPERKLWPVVVSGLEVVWMRGFACPARLRPTENAEAIEIREVPLDGKA